MNQTWTLNNKTHKEDTNLDFKCKSHEIYSTVPLMCDTYDNELPESKLETHIMFPPKHIKL